MTATHLQFRVLGELVNEDVDLVADVLLRPRRLRDLEHPGGHALGVTVD